MRIQARLTPNPMYRNNRRNFAFAVKTVRKSEAPSSNRQSSLDTSYITQARETSGSTIRCQSGTWFGNKSRKAFDRGTHNKIPGETEWAYTAKQFPHGISISGGRFGAVAFLFYSIFPSQWKQYPLRMEKYSFHFLSLALKDCFTCVETDCGADVTSQRLASSQVRICSNNNQSIREHPSENRS